MNKFLKGLCAGALALTCLMFVAAPALASTVTYDAKSGQFTVDTKSGATATDLFENFKYVMPGDTLEQEIVVKNLPADGKQVQLLMRSLGASEENPNDLLSLLTLTVSQTDGDVVSSESPANEAGNLADWVDLGTYSEQKTITLNVRLQVPITLDNRYQNLADEIHHLYWEFKAVEIEPEPSEPESSEPAPESSEPEPESSEPEPESSEPEPESSEPEPESSEPEPESSEPEPESSEPEPESSVPESSGETPQTGDRSPVFQLTVLAVLSGATLFALPVIARRKKNDREN